MRKQISEAGQGGKQQAVLRPLAEITRVSIENIKKILKKYKNSFEQNPRHKCSWQHYSKYCSQKVQFSQFRSVAQLCPTLYDPMNHSTQGLPVHHQLLEFTQTHVHRVGDAIQASHPLLPHSPPAPDPSQYQGLFQ